LSRRTSAVDKKQEVQIEAVVLQMYDEWLATRMEELEDLHTILQRDRSPVPTQGFRYKPVQGRLAPIFTMGIKYGGGL
jgi:hypothetical protein